MRRFILCFCLLVPSLSSSADSTDGRVDFNRDVRPILSDRCFACHGPDEEAREAGLRLDTEEGLLGFIRHSDELKVVEPGKPIDSELFLRVTSKDTDELMPPPDSNLELTEAEIAVLNRWIEQGAEFERHWSLAPLEDTPVPETEGDWGKNAIDAFVLAKLKREGLAPSERASRERLIRRLAFDLIGLPPTLEELDRFVADETFGAYGELVDYFMNKPAYGERMAQDWLDLARYADTHGYQADRYRPQWPWRDWVVRAFNENLPYDDFVTWQLAGDLLPEPTQDQILATAFNRNHMQTEEGGSVEEEFRAIYAFDRTETFGTAFLGMTMQCARCHDHKYDPISQSEYYQLFAFFNSIDESGQTSHFTDSISVPTLMLTDGAKDEELARLRQDVAEQEAATAKVMREARGRFSEWLDNRPAEPEMPGLVGSYSFEALEDGKFGNAAQADKPAHRIDDPGLAEGKVGNAVSLSGENGVAFKGVGQFRRHDPFSLGLWVKMTEPLKRAVIIHNSKAGLDAGSRGYEIYLEEDGTLTAGLTHMWPNNAIKIKSRAKLPVGEWTHIALTYDGSSKVKGLRLFMNGEPQPVEVLKDNLFKNIYYKRIAVDLTIGQRFRDNGFKNGLVDELRVFDRELSPLEVHALAKGENAPELLSKAATELSAVEREALFGYYLAAVDEPFREQLAATRKRRKALNETLDPIPEIMVMRELPEPRTTYILKRGEYDQKGAQVERGTPEAILPWSEGLPKDRLGLARWLFDERNPLTARVAVNRQWQIFFGRGLVETAEDFGSQGDLPSHPQLLDWLAKWFMDNGWNPKALNQLIVSSATYQQSSRASAALLARDPDNRLLARGPKHRLSAEQLRDSALAASGLLVGNVGGPPVKPYQPEGLWREKSGAVYHPDKGEGLYRRSLYTFIKRTSPIPNMITLDASERNSCVLRRQATSTPLQALVLLNDTQFVEAARKIGERILLEGGGTVDQRVRFAFRLLTSREAGEREREVLAALYKEQKALFAAEPEEAKRLLAVGDSDWDALLDPVELAAATILVEALLNYDEAVMKR